MARKSCVASLAVFDDFRAFTFSVASAVTETCGNSATANPTARPIANIRIDVFSVSGKPAY